MTLVELQKLMDKYQTNALSFSGSCHDCKVECEVCVDVVDDRIVISDGAVYEVDINGDKQLFVKCQDCLEADKVLRNYQPCSVYSRVTGYLRPIENWNEAKQQEHKMRQTYSLPDVSDVKGIL